MKLNKTILAAGLVLGFASMANAADQGQGTVTFNGSIIDAPCSIAAGSDSQTVEMGQISNVALQNGGKSQSRVFDIKLENCDITTLKTVTTTFGGAESAAVPGLLGITGVAEGAGIAIVDGTGSVITLGTATAEQTLVTGNNTLAFSAYLQGSTVADAIKPGTFSSVADFTLAYQ
ncbi:MULTISPECIES: fimbrial protein [Yersinia]|uniref:fimbrial protein n=1 Tax=Yersinia TaxID=629 RepID=UPI0005E4E86E|nr:MULTISPECIES: fimbrial protein [Yersinia]OVZ96042.1 fimbria A protein [Yersinia frederiksenii]RXA96653.1 type 1 fimbrial protein [Yersinia sp. 2105 StPb PI]CNI75243.1 putative mannose-resistant/Proteus-like fimbrial protein [Yersinia frederiksenii]CNI77989.1 putative mannose-resistant/Proteus-like fimbrial protein [Yersinia frederiksenii]CNK52755.1 putative mannose-resistant/Proteus-like fimbrial protein [Yersinia frederiksenii]